MDMRVRMDFWRKAALPLACAISTVAASGTAWAHHSTALYDYSKAVTLSGTVKSFRWTNPHSFIQLVVRDGRGVQQEWSIECGTPTGMSRMGWRRSSLTPGDKVSVSIAPIRDGAHGGTLRVLTLANGAQLPGVARDIKGDASGAPSLGIQLPTLQRATAR